MYVSDEAILEIERRHGKPEQISLAYEMTGREFEMLRRSQKNGRAHDVTLFIIRDNRLVVIRKPMYPEGAYRAPSGGIAPGESFEDGALREAYEETGLRVSLEKYLLRVSVRFSHDGESVLWTTHVLSARPVGGRLEPIDTHEIVEARLATVSELRGRMRDALRGGGSAGLRYRSDLNDIVLAKLIEQGAIS